MNWMRLFNKVWRPVAGIGLGINVVMYPWVIVQMVVDASIKSSELGMWIGLYVPMLTAFLSLAGIRQHDKNREYEVSREISMANVRYGRDNGYTSTSRPNREPHPFEVNNDDYSREYSSEFME